MSILFIYNFNSTRFKNTIFNQNQNPRIILLFFIQDLNTQFRVDIYLIALRFLWESRKILNNFSTNVILQFRDKSRQNDLNIPISRLEILISSKKIRVFLVIALTILRLKMSELYSYIAMWAVMCHLATLLKNNQICY